MADRELKVGGYAKFTSTDYPGELAAVVFVQGCPWRCGYCHNPHLQPRDAEPAIAWRDLLAFLAGRAGMLDAVVFSGGEPTLDPALENAMRSVKGLGFKIGLHTAGIYPERLKQVLPLVDWVGLDIKTAFDAYDELTGASGSAQAAHAAARLVIESGVPYEFRTTVHPKLTTRQHIATLTQQVSDMGCETYVLQDFRSAGCRVQGLVNSSGEGGLDGELIGQVKSKFRQFMLRRADG
ncbi:anaerobic ribonucleoside-triphosphate reductase activating protein [Duganella sp. Root198D2]|uniref:anaerobic ribonucleoside-triphosphate reductase activating protein n=1 Tax=Duganella sp. Root198D2 TaxID=1736489 RepID=UPI00070B40CC|nr:anaerobic ribonucleoside-triphosphate reductase activating protein [Duganella sp. Root198D2]KRB98235.1 anaerobic ribonucleoside-triphosphate reductase activating protein [Duganella sp. Root198D2]